MALYFLSFLFIRTGSLIIFRFTFISSGFFLLNQVPLTLNMIFKSFEIKNKSFLNSLVTIVAGCTLFGTQMVLSFILDAFPKQKGDVLFGAVIFTFVVVYLISHNIKLA